MLRIATGYSPEYLLKEVATGRENYYTGAVTEGEPPGRWWGAGAEQLGLTGLVDAQDMRALYERFLDPREDGFSDPKRWDEVPTLGRTGRKYVSEEDLYAQALDGEPDASAERRAELRTEAGKAARHNVAFLDATFSVQKSVTLLHTAFESKQVAAGRAGDEQSAAAWGRFRQAVEDAIWAGNNAALAYLQDRAGYVRVGHHGGTAGRWADAHAFTVASFFQHDSRDRDPQLHIHNAVLNRVEGPDGVWRTLDSRAIHRWRPGAAAIAERTTEERIAHALGALCVTRPDGKAREIVGVSAEAMSLISTRRHAVTAKQAEMMEAFEARFGRVPNRLERDRLAQEATLLTRAGKSHDGEIRAELLDRVHRRLRAEIVGGLDGVADTALDARREGVEPMAFNPQVVIEVALADVAERKSGWTRADLVRAINTALPDYLGAPDGGEVTLLLEQLTDRALEHAVPIESERPAAELLPDQLRLANGESAYLAPGGRVYSTPDQVRSERILLAATAARDGAALSPQAADRFLDRLRAQGVELGADQVAAVRGILASGARVETLVGPAGTGKSYVVGTLARAWTDRALRSDITPGRVFGLATSQAAADVLSGEGLTARNVAAWLGTQQRLHTGAAEQRYRADDEVWRLHDGDLVVVDESAMTDTAALSAIHHHTEQADAKLLLVGDHRQLAAVGAGGGMELLSAAGPSYELTDARRFTQHWERDASLRLRAGDETVLRTYHQRGRIIDAGTRESAQDSAARAWIADTLDGHRSLLLVDTNDQAAELSAQIRAELVRLGRVEEHGVRLGLQGSYAGVGDLVQARQVAWHLQGYEGNQRAPRNRDDFRVTALRLDGAMEVTTDLTGTAEGQRLVLPASYVAEHVVLGYAATVHTAQGATVDTTHCVATARTSPNALYVGMTRGRSTNTAHVVTRTAPDDPADGSAARHELHRDPVAVLATVLDGGDQATAKSSLAIAAESADESGSARTAAELFADAAQLAATERTARSLDRLVTNGTLTAGQHARIAAEDGTIALARLLRRAEIAGHDPDRALTDAIERGQLTGARNLSHVVYSRIRNTHRFDPVGDTWTDWIPRTDNPAWNDYLTGLAHAADQRSAQLGVAAAEDPPRWATDAFGEAPANLVDRTRWEGAVGRIAAYREVRGHDDPIEALGAAPQPSQVEQFAAYRAAWHALGRPEIDREHRELSNGQLRMRIRAYERELAAAPRYVANELAGTRQAAADHHHTAAVRRAEAQAATSDEKQTQLQAAAAQSARIGQLLNQRAEQLQQVDDARTTWLVHTSQTRLQAELSTAELSARDADDDPHDRITAAEWKAAHQAAVAEDERHREITEDDIDLHEQDHPIIAPAADAADTSHRDLREIAAAEPAAVLEDIVRVPDADETAHSIHHAGRVLDEILYRDSANTTEEADHRGENQERWHRDDHDDATEYEMASQSGSDV
ncbi:conjugative relaxase domain-containing protein, TrwC/TraI family [Pseudonocardia ammonioxydans]|uniref:Conjugative relaxase domain-containing protein, TrwC/TraI family n=1 Tax=Pseudonocardia ammonioxydans TaxID=260086 RepID=A0A1I4XW32_PSUAM|nr:MobF family relaxase [Pseudonocardia ammonioxydans]SFN30072.1 conjugative relaxase domain-containing protein, TrwC/TraI family [Pseudonocardia ammonioxydans]